MQRWLWMQYRRVLIISKDSMAHYKCATLLAKLLRKTHDATLKKYDQDLLNEYLFVLCGLRFETQSFCRFR